MGILYIWFCRVQLLDYFENVMYLDYFMINVKSISTESLVHWSILII